MKAVRYHDYGGPEVLGYEDAPIPEPGQGEILVRVHAAGVNPADRQIRAGLRFRREKPFAFIPGCEVSGVVERTGSEVTEFAVDDEVYGMTGFGGGYAEYVAVAAGKLGRKPASLDHVHAAALPVAALTAWDALFEVGGLAAGQKVLIHAAAGGVGHLAVQLAKWRGAQVIGTASAGNEAFLRQLGVDVFIDYRTTAFDSVVRDVDMVLDLIPREADAATDALARETMARSWAVLKHGGIQVSICANPPPGPDAAARGLRGAYAGAKPGRDLLNRIAGLVDDGTLKPTVGTILPLREARQAHELIQRGHTRGKIVLQIEAP
ncbi:MAG: NADP-dependent oxidoreductase [Lentisphaeria bacterium]|nr:NADP-dependent oxidoreductase [Lentisphaeria bacterium]